MTSAAKVVCAMGIASFVASATFSADTKTAYTIDVAKSKIEINVAKDGFLRAFGHDHLVVATLYSGEVHVDRARLEDSSVSFSADANSLHVMDPGESEKDRKEVQTTMLGEQVLDVARYPKIEFSSTAVKVNSAANGKWELQVTGTLSLHGAQKPVTLPVHLQISDDGTLTCDTEVSLLQSNFGILPYKAAGGAVKVKDKLKLVFHIIATKSAG